MIDDLPQECTPMLPDTQGLNSQGFDLSQTFDYGWGTLLPIICVGSLKITGRCFSGCLF